MRVLTGVALVFGLLGSTCATTQEAVTSAPAEAATADSLRWRLAQGEVHHYLEVVTSRGRLGGTTIESRLERWVRMEVLEVRPDGLAVTSFRREAVREETRVSVDVEPEQRFTSDTREGTSHPQHLYELAMIGQEFQVAFTPEGQILSAEPTDRLAHFNRRWSELLAELEAADRIGPDGRPDLPTANLERAVNPAFWQLRWPIVNGESPALGTSWESAQDYPTFFRAEVRTHRTYTVDQIAPDGVARVSFIGERDLAHSIPGAEELIQVDAVGTSGELVFDSRAGYLVSYREELEIRMQIRIPGEDWRPVETNMTFTRTRLDGDVE